MPPPTSPRHDPISPDVGRLDPVPELLNRARAELSASFPPKRPIRVSRAPGRLDVMGGITDYTGGLVCQGTIDRAAAVAVQARDDRQVQVFSFNEFDAHTPFTTVIPLDALSLPIERLRQEFAQPGRKWSGQLAGCLAVLHDEKLIDLRNPELRGVNIALLSNIPAGAGVSRSAAIEVAAVVNVLDHYEQFLSADGRSADPTFVPALCQRVAREVVGRSGSVVEHSAVYAGEPGDLIRMKCQPQILDGRLTLPAGVRVIGIDTGVRRNQAAKTQYARTRAAAFMGHKIILETIRKMGASAGREMIGDPMHGYLANLPLNDYKKYFRSPIPETIKGGQFLLQYGALSDKSSPIEPDVMYAVQGATDHHVFDAHRVCEFVRYIDAARTSDAAARTLNLNKAGHLMYASHISYTRDAKLGADACDTLVDLVRARESDGFYGAKITAAGSGGTVAVLCDAGNNGVANLLTAFEEKTGLKPQAFLTSTPGAWASGTALV